MRHRASHAFNNHTIALHFIIKVTVCYIFCSSPAAVSLGR